MSPEEMKVAEEVGEEESEAVVPQNDPDSGAESSLLDDNRVITSSGVMPLKEAQEWDHN